MNRRVAAAAIAVAVGLAVVLAGLGAADLSPADVGPAAQSAATPDNGAGEQSSDTPDGTTPDDAVEQSTAAADDDGDEPTDEEILEYTRVVSGSQSLSIPGATGQVVRGATPLAPGTGLTVRVRSVDGGREFLRSVETTVESDGTFRGTFDLSSVSPGTTIRVVVRHDGRELANRTGVVVAPQDGTTLAYEGDAVTLRQDAGQVVAGTTDLAPGTTVVVRLHGGGSQVFVEQRSVTVGEDGRFAATFDLSDVQVGANFRVSVRHDGDRLTYAPGEVAGAE